MSSLVLKSSDLGRLGDTWRGNLANIAENIFWLHQYTLYKSPDAIELVKRRRPERLASYLESVRLVSECEERFIQLGSEVQYFPDGRRRIVHSFGEERSPQ